MAIFNESFLQKTIDGFVNEGFLDRFKKKEDKKYYSKPKENKSEEKKKGLLTKEDFNNGISIIKHTFGSDSMFSKYMHYYSISDIMNRYSKSSNDEALVAVLDLCDPDDPDDKDVLIPSPDSDWYDGTLEDLNKLREKVEDHVDELTEKTDKECASKYGDIFDIEYSHEYYGIFFYISSKKSKESSNKDK